MSSGNQVSNVPEDDCVPNHRLRWLPLLIAAVLTSMLVTAAILKPSPAGLGTHQQLGLPPCSARVLFGIRCPGCGMTTSWAYYMRGQWISSMQTNVGGFALALLASCVAVQSLRIGLGRISVDEGQLTWLAIGLATCMALAAGQWVWRLINP